MKQKLAERDVKILKAANKLKFLDLQYDNIVLGLIKLLYSP